MSTGACAAVSTMAGVARTVTRAWGMSSSIAAGATGAASARGPRSSASSPPRRYSSHRLTSFISTSKKQVVAFVVTRTNVRPSFMTLTSTMTRLGTVVSPKESTQSGASTVGPAAVP